MEAIGDNNITNRYWCIYTLECIELCTELCSSYCRDRRGRCLFSTCIILIFHLLASCDYFEMLSSQFALSFLPNFLFLSLLLPFLSLILEFYSFSPHYSQSYVHFLLYLLLEILLTLKGLTTTSELLTPFISCSSISFQARAHIAFLTFYFISK